MKALESGRRRRLVACERAAEGGGLLVACVCTRAEVRLSGCGCAAREGRVSPLRRLSTVLGFGRFDVELGVDGMEPGDLVGLSR